MRNPLPVSGTGIYSLLIKVNNPTKVQVRSERQFDLPSSFFTYSGSALGRGATNLANRLRRHFMSSKRKTLFWHIDYLLHETGPPIGGTYALTSQHLECQLIQTLITHGVIPILGFGSSDCRYKCGGHLISFNNNFTEIQEILDKSYRVLGLNPQQIL
jgi:Uri superfamily endonuclease